MLPNNDIVLTWYSVDADFFRPIFEFFSGGAFSFEDFLERVLAIWTFYSILAFIASALFIFGIIYSYIRINQMGEQEEERLSEEEKMWKVPAAPTPAFKLGEIHDPVSLYKQDIFTVPVNLTGVPAISVPGGTVEREGIALPVGVQYIAPHGGETRLFDLGKKIYDAHKN